MARFLCLMALSLPLLTAAPIAMAAQNPAGSQAQVSQSDNRAFRSCMRAKYGPRYFAGVRRAHRYNMAQACTGPQTRHG